MLDVRFNIEQIDVLIQLIDFHPIYISTTEV